jgi:hypothetical protein
MEKDWRLAQLETQPDLRGANFVRKPYTRYREGWEHDHCAACWGKLAEPENIPDALHEGYATSSDYARGENYEWICVPCFEAFASDMGWTDATSHPSSFG